MALTIQSKIARPYEEPVAVLTLQGPLDSQGLPLFQKEIDSFWGQEIYEIILDCQELTYINSTSLGYLVQALDKCEEKGGELKIVHLSPNVAQLFDMLGIMPLFARYKNLDAALADEEEESEAEDERVKPKEQRQRNPLADDEDDRMGTRKSSFRPFVFLLFIAGVFFVFFFINKPPMASKNFPSLEKIEWLQSTPPQGSLQLVEFWATWCPPCLKSIPHLNEIHEKYASQGLVIMGITNEDRATIAEFQKKVQMKYHVGIEKGSDLSGPLGVTGIPTAFLVKEGKIVWEGHPMGLSDSIIQKYLKK